jgi:hypothetical protein
MGGATISLVGVDLVAAGGFIIVAALDGEGRLTWRRLLSLGFIVAGAVLFIAGIAG